MTVERSNRWFLYYGWKRNKVARPHGEWVDDIEDGCRASL